MKGIQEAVASVQDVTSARFSRGSFSCLDHLMLHTFFHLTPGGGGGRGGGGRSDRLRTLTQAARLLSVTQTLDQHQAQTRLL